MSVLYWIGALDIKTGCSNEFRLTDNNANQSCGAVMGSVENLLGIS